MKHVATTTKELTYSYSDRQLDQGCATLGTRPKPAERSRF